MSTYAFGFVINGFDLDDEYSIDRLCKYCPDSSMESQAGFTRIYFEIDAESPQLALSKAREQIVSGFPELIIRGIDRELVSIPDIAERTSRSPESIRLLTNGKRGNKDFPVPVAVLHGGMRIWEWAEVLQWFKNTKNELIDEPDGILYSQFIEFEISLQLMGRLEPFFRKGIATVRSESIIEINFPDKMTMTIPGPSYSPAFEITR